MSLAIKYRMQQRAKKIASGEPCDEHGEHMCTMCHGSEYAGGGAIHDKGVHQTTHYKELERDERKGRSEAGDHIRSASSKNATPRAKARELGYAKGEHENVLGEMKSMRGQDRKYLYDGGDVEEKNYNKDAAKDVSKSFSNNASNELSTVGSFLKNLLPGSSTATAEEKKEAHGGDIASDIVHRRKYSRGGDVANDTGDGQDADKMENQFDVTLKESGDDFSYTGENSGDELGNAREDEDQRDMVASIMKSRKKKDRLPNPR